MGREWDAGLLRVYVSEYLFFLLSLLLILVVDWSHCSWGVEGLTDHSALRLKRQGSLAARHTRCCWRGTLPSCTETVLLHRALGRHDNIGSFDWLR